MVRNNIDKVMTKKGLKPKWVREEYERVSGLEIDYMALYNIRKNNRQPSAMELFWLCKILELPFNQLIFDKN